MIYFGFIWWCDALIVGFVDLMLFKLHLYSESNRFNNDKSHFVFKITLNLAGGFH